MPIAPVALKMEAKTSNYTEEQEINEEMDDAQHIVSNVIHEYDVIDDPPNSCQSKAVANVEIDEKNNHLSSAPRPIPQNEHTIGEQMLSSSSVSNRHRLSSSDRSNSITEAESTTPLCPKVNCKEKIVSLINLVWEEMVNLNSSGDTPN